MFKPTFFYTAAAMSLIAVTTPVFSFAESLLEEVVVTSSRTETTMKYVGSSVSVITQEELALQNYPAVSDVLRSQAGISVSNNGGPGKATSLRVRGEEGYRTLIIIDGIEVSDPTATQVGPQVQHLSNSADIERIEILRGPQGFAYGADAGGVINIITKTGSSGVNGQISTEGGSYNTYSNSGFIALGDDKTDGFISASKQSTNGYNATTDDITGETDGYANQTIHAKLGVVPNKNVRLEFAVRDVIAENEYDGCGSATFDCQGDFDQTSARASIKVNTEQTGHELSLSRTSVKRTNYSDNEPGFSAKGALQKLDYVGKLELSKAFTLIGGSDIKKENIDATSGESLSRNQLGIFSELQWQYHDALFFSAGARYDDNDDFGKHVSVRATSAYIWALQDGDTIKLRSSFGTGFRAPSLSEIAYNHSSSAFGDAKETVFKEEKSQGIDVGIDYILNNGATLEATYFNQKIKDEIFFDLVNYSGYLQGEGKSDSNGLELAFTLPITENITIYENATYNKTTSSDGAQRIRRPEKMLNFGLLCNFFDQKLNVRLNYRTAKGAVNTDWVDGQMAKVQLDDYQVIDISANYAISSALQLFARVDNALDENYEEITDYYTSETAAYAGARYSF